MVDSTKIKNRRALLEEILTDLRELKTAGHENCSEARQHVNRPVFMCRVPDDDLMIDRHRDENQACKCRRAATHHYKKVVPLIWHKNIFTQF